MADGKRVRFGENFKGLTPFLKEYSSAQSTDQTIVGASPTNYATIDKIIVENGHTASGYVQFYEVDGDSQDNIISTKIRVKADDWTGAFGPFQCTSPNTKIVMRTTIAGAHGVFCRRHYENENVKMP